MKDQRLSVDMISTLPPVIIETILCLLPIQEAIRTSILAKEWRYKWTTIPKIDFNYETFQHKAFDNEHALILAEKTNETYDREHLTRRCRFFVAIYQILFVHQGPIHEFTLSMYAEETYYEIDQIIDHLSRNNTVKKFTLKLYHESSYTLLLSAFPMHHLTDLHLEHCDVYLQPSFNGFGSLTSLCLEYVTISQETLLHLLSKCPLLTKLSLVSPYCNMMRSSPNLETLKLNKNDLSYYETDKEIALEDLSDIWLEHLNEFEFRDLVNIKYELDFVRLILAKSPALKKVSIVLACYAAKDEEMEILRILMGSPCASPLLEITVMGYRDYNAKLHKSNFRKH